MLASLDHPDLRNPIMEHGSYNGGVLGRFISRDPIGFNGSSLNLYSYPTSPVNAVDPSGLEAFLLVDQGNEKPLKRVDTSRACDFLTAVENLEDGTLDTAVVSGHGNSYHQGFDANNPSNPEGFFSTKDGAVFRAILPFDRDPTGYRTPEGRAAKRGDIVQVKVADLFKNKFSKNGQRLLTLQGCNVASNGGNVTRDVSAAIKNVNVAGSGFYTWGFAQGIIDFFSATMGTSNFPGYSISISGDRIYRNAKRTW